MNFGTCVSVRGKKKDEDIEHIISEFGQKTENHVLHK